jgi:hypothetical protein
MEVIRYKLEDVDKGAWNSVLQGSGDATIFHSLEWIRILKKSFNLNETLLICQEEGKPLAIFPYYHSKKALFDLYGSPIPETGTMYGGPISIDRVHSSGKLIENFEGAHGPTKAYFMKLAPEYNLLPLRERGYSIEEVKNFILDLNRPVDKLWMNLNKKSRNQVRKAKKFGVKVLEGTPSDLHSYYDMNLETCKRNSLNPLPLKFYENLFNELYNKKMMKLSLAYHGKMPVAGAIFLLFKKNIIYWSGDSYSRFWHLNPNDLIQWDIIEWGGKNGYWIYDLGGAGIPTIAKFKAGWGGKEVPFYRAYKGSLLVNLTMNIYAKLRKYPVVSRIFRSVS